MSDHYYTERQEREREERIAAAGAQVEEAMRASLHWFNDLTCRALLGDASALDLLLAEEADRLVHDEPLRATPSLLCERLFARLSAWVPLSRPSIVPPPVGLSVLAGAILRAILESEGPYTVCGNYYYDPGQADRARMAEAERIERVFESRAVTDLVLSHMSEAWRQNGAARRTSSIRRAS